MYSTRVSRVVHAPRAEVFRALVDADAIASWRVPDNMHATVHSFDARPGGRFRVTLTYDDPAAVGKTEGASDTYAGTFVEIVDGERVVEEFAFESSDPALRRPMRMTTTLTDADGGTNVEILHEGIADEIPAADNEVGTRMALAALARMLEK
jgi:uncharacterized protein YndB with AHSA1/START domain